MLAPSTEFEPCGPRQRVLWLSTVAFTLLFAVWLMLGVLGIPIRNELRLSPVQFDWLLAVAILAGSLPRLHFGIWADRYGGRRVMTWLLVFTALPCFWLSRVTSYEELLVCAVLFGLAGNSFTVGIAWNSAWFPDRSKGTALGVFGAGNVGASATKFLAPVLLAVVPSAGLWSGVIPGGWRLIPILYAIILIVMAAAVWWFAPSSDRCPGRGRPLADVLAPLRHSRVWRFSLYYVVVFGAYVALSAYLPRYYVDVYGLPLTTAGYLTALFIFPASLLRPLGGWLSDRIGPRGVTQAAFIAMIAALALLSLPTTILSLDMVGFTALLFVVACAMGIGKGSVFKYVPNYFPRDVGAVGGLVGMLGALGGFLFPPAFGVLERSSGFPQAAFAALLVPTVASLVWLRAVVVRIKAAERAMNRIDEVPEPVAS